MSRAKADSAGVKRMERMASLERPDVVCMMNCQLVPSQPRITVVTVYVDSKTIADKSVATTSANCPRTILQ
jgi:hypothetical protein